MEEEKKKEVQKKEISNINLNSIINFPIDLSDSFVARTEYHLILSKLVDSNLNSKSMNFTNNLSYLNIIIKVPFDDLNNTDLLNLQISTEFLANFFATSYKYNYMEHIKIIEEQFEIITPILFDLTRDDLIKMFPIFNNEDYLDKMKILYFEEKR